MNDKWTEEDCITHIKANCDYSSAVVIAALWYKLYGKFPEIGLSGHQGSGAEFLVKQFPDIKEK